ncbi:MAG: putative glycosyl transferase, family 2 [Thermomicrobiales bacterium]|nr:putative glycosyl transferase, family 2 [Thermomicrobiales bacterium]
MAGPKVSVVMSSYNHAPFVAQAIGSVLEQTFPDFEFIVADDGSSDSTAEVIRGFSDPRLDFTAHPRNRGAAAVTNESLRRCRGEYIARINSDDFWPLDKLAYQVAFLDTHPECAAMFGDATFVDASGAPLDDRPHPFAPPNTTRGGWLRRFFDEGNCLCHPTLLIRRSCVEALGPYDNRLRQVPDFDMWVRLAKRYAFVVSDRALVYFRILPGENASAPSPENLVRHSAEHFLIAERFFEGVDRDVLREGFGDLLVVPELPTDIHCDIEQALLYFRPGPYAYLRPIYRVVGLRKLEALLGSPSLHDILCVDYGIDELAFQRLAGTVDTFTLAYENGAATATIDDLLPPPAPPDTGAAALPACVIPTEEDSRVSGATPPLSTEIPRSARNDTRSATASLSGAADQETAAAWQPLVQAASAALDDGRLAEGRAACLALLGDVGLPEDVRDLVYAIQAELAQPLADFAPSATRHELVWPAPDGAARRDPSPVLIDERLLVFGRSRRATADAGQTGRNDVLLRLDGDDTIADIVSLVDETGLAHRFDDVRPFLLDGLLHAAVLLDDPGVDGGVQAGIVAIDHGAFRNPRWLGPRAGAFLQGWAPISASVESRFLAWWEPTEVLRLDRETGVFQRESLRRASHVAERFWSGSQGVSVPGGSLLLVNETAGLDGIEETVTTRFVLLDTGFRLAGISPPFFVADRGNDVATGLARRGDRLVAGFTSGEASAVLVSVALVEALAMIMPIGTPGDHPLPR